MGYKIECSLSVIHAKNTKMDHIPKALAAVAVPLLELYKQQWGCKNCFAIERLIDADCDGKNLTVGIASGGKQGIRLGADGAVKHLVSLVKEKESLLYNFEDNTRLVLTKNNNAIMYTFEMPPGTKIVKIDNPLLSLYKTIDMDSSELDAIAELK